MGNKVKDITAEEAKKYLDTHAAGKYNLVDVRQDWEYEEFHLPGAKFVPLPELPDRMGEIDPHKPTIVYCAAGARSAAAAKLLAGQGFHDVNNMLGGISAWKNEYVVGPRELGMAYFSGDETPLEILILAYTMEANLGAFYSTMAETAKPEIADVFNRLLKFEKGHKAKVFNLARELDPSLKSQEDLVNRLSVKALEGGMTAAEFIGQNEAYLKTPKGAVEAAMIFEAQAIDLYLRYSEKAKKTESIGMLQQLAQEEKNHLKLLGKLMVRKIVEPN